MSTAPTFIAFMCHIQKEHFKYLESTLQEYNIGQYLIGYESTPYEHYHFLVQMSSDDYHLFAERVFRKKFKLRGRASNNQPRQYGKLKKIEDFNKLASYTIKDGDFKSNMPETDVQKYFEQSFKKEEKKKLMVQCAEAIELTDTQHYAWTNSNAHFQHESEYIKYNLKYIKLLIINYLRITSDINMCRSNIMSYTQYYLKTTQNLEETQKDKYLYYLLF